MDIRLQLHSKNKWMVLKKNRSQNINNVHCVTNGHYRGKSSKEMFPHIIIKDSSIWYLGLWLGVGDGTVSGKEMFYLMIHSTHF